MTKAELINAVHLDGGVEISKKQCEKIVDTVFKNIGKAIKKEKRFAYPGFGTFNVRKRKAWMGRNPQTGEKIKIKASKTVGFKPAPSFKSAL